MLTKIDEYIESVCKQIRAKKAHKFIKTELENHIVEQKNAFEKQGMDEEIALEKAITEMGNPISVGTELDRIHRPKPEWSVIFLTVTIVIIGLFLNRFIFKDNASNTNLFIYAVIGTIALSIIYFVDYSIIGKYPKILLLAFIILCLLISPQNNPVQYRKLFGQLSFLSVPLYAGLVYSLRGKGYLGIVLCNFLALGLAVLTSFHGVYMISTVCCMSILAVAIAKNFFDVNKKIAFIMYIFFILIMAFIIFSDFGGYHRLLRIQVFLNPYRDVMGAGYQSVIRREIIKHSQPIGIFQPFQFLDAQVNLENISSFLPEYNDLMILYLISKFGFIPVIFIILIIVTLIIRLFVLSFKQKNSLGFIVSFACTSVITLQSIVYIFNSLGFNLFTAGGLPLISSGVNLISSMCLMGILLSVFRNDSLIRDTTVKIKPSEINRKIFNLILNRLNYLNDKYYS